MLTIAAFACSGTDSPLPGATGGAATGGKTATGGASTGGANTGGSSTGGDMATGGANTGGSSTGGDVATGGASTGGASTGGKGGAGPSTGGAKGGSTGSEGGSSGGACSSALQLCEDFETGMPGSAWKINKSGQFTATVGTDQAHSGTHSLHIVAPNVTNSAFMSESKTFPATDFWGRAWLRYKAPPGGHQMFIYLALPGGDQLRLLNRLGSSEAIQVNVQSTDKFYASKTTITEETWFCYEWHVTGSATQIFKDGVELTDIKAPGATGATSFNIGFQRFQTGTAAGDLWIDDVAINSTQVGCK